MSIRDWPAAERPREKLLEHGALALSDAELLAIFLRTGVAGLSAVDLARQLLSDFGGLRPLLEADLPGFSARLGLGPAKYAQLQAVLEMGRRHLAETLRRESALESPQAVRDYLKARLRHEPHEVFGCLYLDSKHRVLAYENLFYGSIDGASVYPRQVVKRYTVIQDAGKAVHPSYVEGQLQGGAAQGIGWALWEEYLFDKNGRMENPGFLDYRMPVASDLPMLDAVVVEVPNPLHPYGVRGVGETPICPPLATVGNAVSRAIGIRMHQLPMTPPRVLDAIETKKG